MGANVQEQVVRFYRDKIPPFACVPGCHDCCGPVAASKWEIDQMGPPPPQKGASWLSCRFLGPDGCQAYAERPLICRLYGTVPSLRCPHGRAPLVLLDAGTEAQLNQFFRKTPHQMV